MRQKQSLVYIDIIKNKTSKPGATDTINYVNKNIVKKQVSRTHYSTARISVNTLTNQTPLK